MITIEQATKEISLAIAGMFPEQSTAEWRRNIATLIGTPLRVDPQRPYQRAREVALRFGERAMNRYRAAGADTRGRRRSVLQTLIRKRMTAYDPAENAKKGEVVPQFVIECEEAISN